MGELKLLDCTLRDGGYVNDWKFGHDNMVSIFERLVDAEIDIIEIGFLDERREFDPDRSIMPDTKSVEKNYESLGAEEYNKHPVGTGPYKFVERKTGEKIILEANEDYWRGSPKIKTITFKIMTDSNTAVLQQELHL